MRQKGRSLNLKDPRAHELAARLAQRTGESLTAVVIRALEKSLHEADGRADGKTTAERILEFAGRFAQGMPRTCDSAGHADLYDEAGLPR